RYFSPVRKPKALMLIGGSVSSYEAGEVWHLLDTRMGMPITKVPVRLFDRINWSKYNTLVMVSSRYSELDSVRRARIQNWIAQGNTLITIRQASSWAIRQQLVKEKLVSAKKENTKDQKEQSPPKRLPYVDAPENIGKNAVGGTIFKIDVDLSHPLAFGYTRREVPVYRNSTVWLAPSQNPYATVGKYTDDPLIDGFITQKNLNEFLKPSASLIVSRVGRGRVVMFAENPNFRGTWYGTNRLFMNALYFGNEINVPNVSEEE
ncbi:MAG: zinc carboxypeptidase, partial [Bacteroidota bacterium]